MRRARAASTRVLAGALACAALLPVGPGAAGEAADHIEEVALRSAGKVPGAGMVGPGFLPIADASQVVRRRAVRLDAVQRAESLLELHPPERGGAVREAGGDVGGERRAVPFEDRQGMLDEVAVARRSTSSMVTRSYPSARTRPSTASR